MYFEICVLCHMRICVAGFQLDNLQLKPQGSGRVCCTPRRATKLWDDYPEVTKRISSVCDVSEQDPYADSMLMPRKFIGI